MKYSYQGTREKPRARDDEIVEAVDAVDVYLRDIAAFRPLEGPEERALGERLEGLRRELRQAVFAHPVVAEPLGEAVATLRDAPASAERYLRISGSRQRREALAERVRAAVRAWPDEPPAAGDAPHPQAPHPEAQHPEAPQRNASHRNGTAVRSPRANGTVHGSGNGTAHADPGSRLRNGEAARNGSAGANRVPRGGLHREGELPSETGAPPGGEAPNRGFDALAALPFHMSFVRELAQRILGVDGTADDRTPAASTAVRAALAAYGDAVRTFATHYLDVVVQVARRMPAQGLPLADLIQEGNTGLLVALDRYEPEDGPFPAFARGPVQDAVRRHVAENARIIRVPPKQWKNLRKLARFRDEFLDREGREPGTTECARHLGVHEDEVRALDRLERLPVSIDEAHDEDDESTLGDTIEDEKARTPMEELHRRQLSERLYEVLQTLSVRERNVLRLRFGLGDARPQSVQEVAETMRVSPNRVRKIQSNAVRKIHDSDLRNEFEAYVAETGED